MVKKRVKPMVAFERLWERETQSAGHDLFKSLNHELKEKKKRDHEG